MRDEAGVVYVTVERGDRDPGVATPLLRLRVVSAPKVDVRVNRPRSISAGGLVTMSTARCSSRS